MVASGDTDWEQAVKLAVRDACLARAREVAADCADADAAYAALNANLAAFQSAATIAAREMGFDGEVTVETGAFTFPDRVYGALFVPAGDYRALRVTLGGGGGHNWWCVVFPPLCLTAAETEAAFEELDEGTRAVISEDGTGVVFRFRLLELWGELREILGI